MSKAPTVWLNTDELAERYGIAKSTQALYRSQKKIPYSKIGGFIFYSEEKINKWIEDHSQEVIGDYA